MMLATVAGWVTYGIPITASAHHLVIAVFCIQCPRPARRRVSDSHFFFTLIPEYVWARRQEAHQSQMRQCYADEQKDLLLQGRQQEGCRFQAFAAHVSIKNHSIYDSIDQPSSSAAPKRLVFTGRQARRHLGCGGAAAFEARRVAHASQLR